MHCIVKSLLENIETLRTFYFLKIYFIKRKFTRRPHHRFSLGYRVHRFCAVGHGIGRGLANEGGGNDNSG